jgi:transcriptional regulator with PAS, ATPase and Fis domain
MFNGGNLTNLPSLQELILDSIDERVIFHDSQMKVRWANQAASETYNLPLIKIIGRHCSDILGRSRKECANCPVKKALKTKKREQDLLTFPDGKSFLIFAYPIHDNDKLLGVIEFSVNMSPIEPGEKIN